MRMMRHLPRTLAALTTLVLAGGCGGGFNNTVATPSTGPVTFGNYVALGDGFASAPYLGPDVSGTDCLRSSENYPAQVARALKVSSVTDVTCLGATTQDLTAISSPPNSEKKLAPQLDAVTKETDLVTIGIGLEDRGLLRNMFRICLAEPCGDDVLAPTLTKQLEAFGSAFASAIRTIQDVAPRATVIVVGYPQLMPPSESCDGLPKTDGQQLEFAYELFEELNGLLRSAAFQTGSSFIDVAELSADKTICSADPWMNGSKTIKGESQGFHPVPAEQAAVAEAITRQVQLLSSSRG